MNEYKIVSDWLDNLGYAEVKNNLEKHGLQLDSSQGSLLSNLEYMIEKKGLKIDRVIIKR